MSSKTDATLPEFGRTDEDYREQFQAIAANTFENAVAQLTVATDPRLKNPFYIRGYSEEGSSHAIPVNPLVYQSTRFDLATEPQSEEGIVYKRVDFGYDINGEFRRIGFLNYIRLNTVEENVAEIGFGSELARDYFQYHLFGRTCSLEARERMRVVQEAIFTYVRSNPTACEKLREFSRSRGWPTGLEDVAGLAYFDNRITPLEDFAASQSISDEEMYLTGWYDLSFTQSGQPTYSVRDFKVVRIPYFKDKRIEVWRTRNLRPSRATSHKYTSWPLDRSVERVLDVEEKLYYGWDLNKATGKTLVITEGEFKCLVATEMSGILTVGIPGITEVDETIIHALVHIHASEYIVILDRDPRGKGFMRVDGITDSERAAYGIAVELLRAGAQNVRVGQIPNVRNGQKVGVDDLILDNGVEAYLQVIENAVAPAHYAASIDLNETFFLLMRSRQRIKKAVEFYEHSERRGGQCVDEEVYQEALWLRDETETLYFDFLLDRFRGAYRIDQPSRKHMVFFRSSSIDDADKKIAMTQNGEGFALERFLNDIIFFQYYPADTPHELLHVGRNDLMFPFSMEAILQFFETGESDSPDFLALIQQGLEVLGKTTEEGQAVSWKSVHDVGITLLAGHACADFPTDEFRIVPDLAFYVDKGTHWEEHVRVPLTIFKKVSGEAVAFVNLTIWEVSENQSSALMLDNRLFLFVSSFLRRRNTIHDELKFRMVTETLYPYWFDRKKKETVETMSFFGVSEKIVEKQKLIALSLADYQELIDHFAFRRLLNQATHSGLFRMDDEQAKILPRFQGDTILLPVFNEKKEIVSLRLLPLTLEDHVPPTSDPSEKLIRQIDGGDRHLLRNLDPQRQLYMQERLHKAHGQQLLVTLHELDGLILASPGGHVVSLNHTLELHPDIIAKMCSAAPESLCFILSGQIPRSPYDDFNFDAIHGCVKDLYNMQEAVNASLPEGAPPISFSFTILPFALTHLAAQQELSEVEVSTIIESSVRLQAYLQEHKFNSSIHGVVQRFLRVNARLLDYLEVQALPDILDERPIEWWIKENKRLYAAIQTYAKQTHNLTLPSVETYFQNKLHLEHPFLIEELVRLRREEEKVFLHKPLYSLKTSISTFVTEEFSRLFHSVVVERTPVEVRDIRNILSLHVRETLRVEKQVASDVLHVEDTSTLLVPQNAKGALFELHQKSPQQFSRPKFFQESKRGDAFTMTARIHALETHTDITGTGTAPRKRDAESLACEQILQQIGGFEVAPSSVTEHETDKNPKGRVYEILQKAHASFKEPSIVSTERENGFEVSVTLSYYEREYSGRGVGRTKREAEREAFLIILEEMDGERSSLGLTRVEATKIEMALHMSAGDKNYIGHTYTLAQRLQVPPPLFVTTSRVTEEEPEYHTHVSVQLTDVLTVEGEADSVFQDDGRQQAALDLLSKLAEILRENETPEEEVLCEKE